LVLKSSRVKFHASLYLEPPTEETNVLEFEKLALERMQLLKMVESCSVAKGSEKILVGYIIDNTLRIYQSAIDKSSLCNPHQDELSHFILRLCYCSNSELQGWFIQQESKLLGIRLKRLEIHGGLARFIESSGLEYISVTPEDLKVGDLQHYLQRQCLANRIRYDTTKFFKMPFEEALWLVRKKMVFLRQGTAYVPWKYLTSVIIGKFKKHLQTQLEDHRLTHLYYPPDRRIRGLVSSIPQFRPVTLFGGEREQGTLDPTLIPKLVVESFPPCMAELYRHLKHDSHLRYEGRRLLGLFLKGIGLGLNDAITFWREAFSRKTPSTEFHKAYGYGIRHSYGKEGGRKQYRLPGCAYMIRQQPRQGEYHGCPFKTCTSTQLVGVVRSCGGTSVDGISKLVKDDQPQAACQRLFLDRHPKRLPPTEIQHPNQFYDEVAMFWDCY